MRRLLLTVACLLVSAPALAQWREGAVAGVPVDRAPTVLWVTHTHLGEIPNLPMPKGQWNTLDLTNGPQWVFQQPNLPEDTIAVFLAGHFIITNDKPWTCDLTLAVRPPGGTLTAGNYQQQTLAVGYGSVRTNAAVMVPVINRRAEFLWNFTDGCPVIINLTLQYYLRSGGPIVPPDPPVEPTPTGPWPFTCSSLLACLQGLVQRSGG